MYRVVFIEPTFQICGGDHRVEELASDKYATFPSAVLITQCAPKDFRKAKFKNRDFFKQLGLNYDDYCVATRGYDYNTLEEAVQKKLYEGNGRGDYIRVNDRWVQI